MDDEDEDQIEEEERMQKAYELFEKAKTYLSAAVKHADNHSELFDDWFRISMYFNLAWVHQKISNLKEWGSYLDKVIELIEKQDTNSDVSEFNKMRHLSKFMLQQCAIKSQTDNHLKALDHGKASVKNCHNLLIKTYKLWKKQVNVELKKEKRKKMRMSHKPKETQLERSLENEYGAKDFQKSKPGNLNDSKYFSKADKTPLKRRKRRWYSEENSRNSSTSLSTRKVILHKKRWDSRESSFENIHTFHLKQSSTEKSLLKSSSINSFQSDKGFIWNPRTQNLLQEQDNSTYVHIEERVKLLKNTKINHSYTCLHEIWKQIKEFKAYYIQTIQKQQNNWGNFEQNSKKKLWVSFNDNEEIKEILKDQSFKINTRSLLGVKNNNDWIFGLNIGNIMHLTPWSFEEFKNDLSEPNSQEKLNHELSTDSILEKIILLSSAYFWIATEFRFLNKKENEEVFPKKLSEMWHAKSVHTWAWFLPKESPLSIHIHSSYLKHHLNPKIEQREKLRKEREKQELLEAKKREAQMFEKRKRKQEEFKKKIINEFLEINSRNRYLQCKNFCLTLLR